MVYIVYVVPVCDAFVGSILIVHAYDGGMIYNLRQPKSIISKSDLNLFGNTSVVFSVNIGATSPISLMNAMLSIDFEANFNQKMNSKSLGIRKFVCSCQENFNVECHIFIHVYRSSEFS